MTAAAPFQAAWTEAAKAGLARPDLQLMADPFLAQVDEHLAWWAASVVAEATAFQRALGEWTDTPLPPMEDVREALRGLRRGATARGPGWWRDATRWWREASVDAWRRALEDARQAAWQRQAQTQRLHTAVNLAREALAAGVDRLRQWETAHPDQAPAAAAWFQQAALLGLSLGMLEQRTRARWDQEKHLVSQFNQACALVELVRTSRGEAQADAWRKLAAELPTLQAS